MMDNLSGSILVGYGQFFSSFSPSCGQDFPAVGCGHSFAEAVFVLPFAVRRLKGALTHGSVI